MALQVSHGQHRARLHSWKTKRGKTYVHNPTVDVPKFLQAEESCAMSRVIECVGLPLNELLWHESIPG